MFLQHFRYADRSVSLLVVFHDRDHGAAHRDHRRVIHVHVLDLPIRAAYSGVEPARLIGGHEIRRVCLAISALSRHPCLYIYSSVVRRALIHRALEHHLVRELERAHEIFLNAHDKVLLLKRALRHDKCFELDLVKLVLAENSARIFSRRAGLATKGGRISHIPDRKFFFVDDLIHMQGADRVLRASDKYELIFFKNITLIHWVKPRHTIHNGSTHKNRGKNGSKGGNVHLDSRVGGDL